MPYSGDALSPPGGPDGVQCFMLHIFASHSWFNAVLHVPKQQSSLEFMFNSFDSNENDRTSLDDYEAVYATSQINTL